MFFKVYQKPWVSRINVKATEPNSDAGGAVNVRGHFWGIWNPNFDANFVSIKNIFSKFSKTFSEILILQKKVAKIFSLQQRFGISLLNRPAVGLVRKFQNAVVTKKISTKKNPSFFVGIFFDDKKVSEKNLTTYIDPIFSQDSENRT